MITRSIIGLAAVCGVAVISGCLGASPPTRFYTLSPPETGPGARVPLSDTVVAVGPVQIPSYIDRRQIVTRSGENGIDVADFDQWGGPLDEEITRSLVAVLSERLARERVTVVPWRSVRSAGFSPSVQVPVLLSRFDGKRGESVTLRATWTVLMKGEGGEKKLKVRESTITEGIKGESLGEVVAAMGRAVGKMGTEMADDVSAAFQKRGSR